MAAVAKQERTRLSGRTIAGLERARKAGRVGGRPKAIEDHKLVEQVAKLKAEGKSIRVIAEALEKSPTTIQKLVKDIA